jgi:hypothetical protein
MSLAGSCANTSRQMMSAGKPLRIARIIIGGYAKRKRRQVVSFMRRTYANNMRKIIAMAVIQIAHKIDDKPMWAVREWAAILPVNPRSGR